MAPEISTTCAVKAQEPETSTEDAALDRLSVYTIRLLSADMVDRANSGHLGAPFGCAPLANALFSKIMHFSPRTRWANRDRFVLSIGHASAMYYTMLHLAGNGLGGPYEVSMDALKAFRQAGSSTPGHPEFRMTSGVEVTTGPLGQGFANAVGIAISEAHLSARFNKPGYPIFDHYTYCLCGDGCLMEGVSSEAASLAGHLRLHKLIVFYDDNRVSIDGSTEIAFTEDVGAGFAAKRWNVLYIENGDQYDSAIFERTVEQAKSQTDKPTIVIVRTTIGCGAGREIEGKAKAHGGKFSTLETIRQKWFSPDGLRNSGDPVDAEVARMVEKELCDLAAYTQQLSCESCGKSVGVVGGSVLPKFHVPKQVLRKFREYGEQGDKRADDWTAMLERYYNAFADEEPDLVTDLRSRMTGKYLSDKWAPAVDGYLRAEQEKIDSALGCLKNNDLEQPSSVQDDDGQPNAKRQRTQGKAMKYKAGRVYTAEVLKFLVEHNPSVIGGSADVASSCGGHFPSIQGHFLPPALASSIKDASYSGRYIHFGVREHAALAILNGISSYSCLIPYSTYFTVFYQYGLAAVRMAAISKFPVLYIGTHDSIDVGEDGPTHQPVEVLPQLRAMPNLLVIRPGCMSEIVGSFKIFAEQYEAPRQISQYVDPKPLKRRPVFIMTSRGELGFPYKSNSNVRGEDGVQKGAYVVHECYDDANAYPPGQRPLPDIVLIASGQDVGLVMQVKELLLEMSEKLIEQTKEVCRGLPPVMMKGMQGNVIKVRVVSMPCWELFDEQEQSYQDSVLLSNYDDILRIYVEKASTKNTGHDKYAHFSVLMPSFGISGKASEVERKLEFTPDFIAAKVWAKWMDRGRRGNAAGDKADLGLSTWVSHLGSRVGAH
eukprot:TRINITY_DN18560_c0_g1_i1.p1 TRINITY_DN18560_c0_g1~~TRINITY_DN18560_c0_g1_i1.p1  ORF type:complete len:883 (-),score=183.18 TRINITY_DN18560_c0_g1_i1:231-2879(-)